VLLGVNSWFLLILSIPVNLKAKTARDSQKNTRGDKKNT
jgi:hypothetical protein